MSTHSKVKYFKTALNRVEALNEGDNSKIKRKDKINFGYTHTGHG